jgi:hypothetical protein
MATLQNILALGATALAFITSVPSSAHAQRPDSRGLSSDYDRFLSEDERQRRAARYERSLNQMRDYGRRRQEEEAKRRAQMDRWLIESIGQHAAQDRERRQRQEEMNRLWGVRFVNGVPAGPFTCPGAVPGATLPAWDPDNFILQSLMAACTSGNGFGGSTASGGSGGSK